MSVVREARSRMEGLEARVPPELRDEVWPIRMLLADPERQWIGTVEAQRLLGVQSINRVKDWARLGMLRSWRGPNGRLKAHLEDVIREARAQRKLEAGDESDDPALVDEAIRRAHRQLRNPAERARRRGIGRSRFAPRAGRGFCVSTSGAPPIAMLDTSVLFPTWSRVLLRLASSRPTLFRGI